jgi:predicted amidohydrolase
MRVGFVQLAPVLADRDATIVKIDRLLAGVDLPKILVFPELCNSGYNFTSPQQACQLAETVENSVFLAYLAEICRRAGCFIVTGLNELDGESVYNTAVLLGPDGYIGKYRKLHLFLNERDIFRPGDLGLPVFDLGFCRLGMLICFDWIFPEAWRVLALQGADIICHPSNLVLPGMAQRGVGVHAMTNRVYIILANRTGAERDLSFTGCSLVADPSGDTLVAVDDTAEGVFATGIDLEKARDKRVTARNDIFADRRPREYRLLTELDIPEVDQ